MVMSMDDEHFGAFQDKMFSKKTDNFGKCLKNTKTHRDYAFLFGNIFVILKIQCEEASVARKYCHGFPYCNIGGLYEL